MQQLTQDETESFKADLGILCDVHSLVHRDPYSRGVGGLHTSSQDLTLKEVSSPTPPLRVPMIDVTAHLFRSLQVFKWVFGTSVLK